MGDVGVRAAECEPYAVKNGMKAAECEPYAVKNGMKAAESGSNATPKRGRIGVIASIYGSGISCSNLCIHDGNECLCCDDFEN